MPGVRVPRQEDHRNASLGEQFGDFQAVEDRHFEIGDRDVNLVLNAKIEELLTIGRVADDLVSER
jgi:hypothetical protein